MMLTNLADVCRRAGLRVVEERGWERRGSRGRGLVSVESIICHHTGTAATAKGDYPTLRVVRDGHPSLSGPLSQLGLGRDGSVYVIAAGLANHAGRTAYTHQQNSRAIGIEAEHPGGIAPWPAAQYAAYVRLVAALCEAYDVPVSRVQGHKEIAVPHGRKVDPNFDMGRFRAALTGAAPSQPRPTVQEDEMPLTPTDLAAVRKIVHDMPVVYPGQSGKTIKLGDAIGNAHIYAYRANMIAARLAGQVNGLAAAIAQVSTGKPVDLAAITAAAKAGADEALDERIADARVELTTKES